MTIDEKNLIDSMMASLSRCSFIKSNEIPDIDLYMDQVTTFLDDRLKASTRDKNVDEKVMTKTMINNYAKNEVIPAPDKKKYSKDHMLLLIFIFYYKSFLQINDIKELLDPISENFFNSEDGFGVEDIYNEVFGNMDVQLKDIIADVEGKYDMASASFANAPEEQQEYLKKFYFVCKLGADIFLKKLIIEKVVDSFKEHRTEDKKDKKN